MKNLWVTGSVLGMAFSVFAAHASVSDTVRSRQLEAAQVVGTRANQRTPIAFTNITQRQLRKKNIGPDVPYLLSSLPSVTMSSDAGGAVGPSYMRIRGTDASRINITANGIPLNDSESNAIYWVNMGDFAGSLGSMQVQRGVGTSTNGSGAFGATVNMQTEAIPEEAYVRLDASGGSYDTHKESVHFGTGLLRDHWAFAGRLSNIGSKGYVDGASSSLNSYFLQGAYYADKTVVKLVTFNGTERTGLAWDYASKADMAKYGRRYNPLGLYENDKGETVRYKDNVDNYHQQHYQLFLNQELTPYLSLHLAAHYTHGKGYYQQYKKNRKLYEYGLSSSLGKKSDLIRRKYSAADFYGSIFSLNYKDERLNAVLGGGWNKYDGDHFGEVRWVRKFDGAINPNQRYYDNLAHKQDMNIYARGNYKLMNGLSAYADLQYRYVDYKMYGQSDEYDKGASQFIVYDENNHFHFFNPKMGLTWDIAPQHKLYGSWAMAHKEPTRKDYENATEGGTEKPKAETLNDIECGYKYRTKNFSAGINLYYMLYKDQFVLTGEVNQIGVPKKQNVGDSYRRGMELEAAWRPLSWLTWEANATWSHNRIKDYHVSLADGEMVNLGDTPISFSPNLIANNSLAVHVGGFEADIRTHYVGEQYMTNTGFKHFETTAEHEGDISLDAYSTTDVHLNYSWKQLSFCKHLTVGCTVYNVFNKKYFANGYASTDLVKEDGKIVAKDAGNWNAWSAFSAQAPANFMLHLSIGI